MALTPDEVEKVNVLYAENDELKAEIEKLKKTNSDDIWTRHTLPILSALQKISDKLD